MSQPQLGATHKAAGATHCEIGGYFKLEVGFTGERALCRGRVSRKREEPRAKPFRQVRHWREGEHLVG